MNNNRWTPANRLLVFALGASSILCLLLDFYRICPMRTFTLFIFFPAMLVLAAVTLADLTRPEPRLAQSVLLGLIGGLLAAVSYDIFRLPFVFAREWGISSVIPPMNLFKVFPGFGAMVLGQPIEQDHYSTATQIVGWLYHFSNGATFGVMYMAMIGDASRRHWLWAVLFAVGLELGMLFTPYAHVFGIPLTAKFVVVTMAAHAIFGVCLGLAVRKLAKLHFTTINLKGQT